MCNFQAIGYRTVKMISIVHRQSFIDSIGLRWSSLTPKMMLKIGLDIIWRKVMLHQCKTVTTYDHTLHVNFCETYFLEML